MALQVTINSRIQSKVLGVIFDSNASFWDPLTLVNLNKGNPTSADLSTQTNAALINISNSVYMGTLTLANGTLGPAVSSTWSMPLTAAEALGPSLLVLSGTAANANGIYYYTPTASAGQILPPKTANFSTYSLYASSSLINPGSAGTYYPGYVAGASGYGITGLAANETLEPKNTSYSVAVSGTVPTSSGPATGAR